MLSIGMLFRGMLSDGMLSWNMLSHGMLPWNMLFQGMISHGMLSSGMACHPRNLAHGSWYLWRVIPGHVIWWHDPLAFHMTAYHYAGFARLPCNNRSLAHGLGNMIQNRCEGKNNVFFTNYVYLFFYENNKAAHANRSTAWPCSSAVRYISSR
jgi:hypothetical protein